MKAFKHFDLPNQHLTGEKHYVPPKARDSDEIDRRRSLPKGTILAEHEMRGIHVASHILNSVKDKEEQDFLFASKIIAASGLNSAWYGFARGSSVMRRRLFLPILVSGDPFDREYTTDVMSEANYHFQDLTYASENLVAAIEGQKPNIEERRIKFGRRIGTSSLALACVQLGNKFENATEYVAQSMARQQSLIALRDARSLNAEIGTPPSLAQLADPDSDLSVYFRRSAPDGAYEAFDEAAATYTARA